LPGAAAAAAEEFGLANVTAIQTGTAPADFRNGANFAIISATANNGTFFAGNGMNINPFSLDTQMLWFRTHLRQLAQAAATRASPSSTPTGTAP